MHIKNMCLGCFKMFQAIRLVVEGTKPRGRHKFKWLDIIKTDLKGICAQVEGIQRQGKVNM